MHRRCFNAMIHVLYAASEMRFAELIHAFIAPQIGPGMTGYLLATLGFNSFSVCNGFWTLLRVAYCI